MGNVFSSDLTCGGNVRKESELEINMMTSKSEDCSENQEFHDAIDEVDDREERIKAKEAEMEAFRRQLEIKREQRRGILDRHKSEKKELEVSLDNERKAKLESYESNKALRELLILNNIDIPEHLQSFKENSDLADSIMHMKEEFQKLKSSNNRLRRDLADSNVALQGAYSDIADLHIQNTGSMKQINALKEVVAVSKTMLNLRETQLDELKSKLSEIERSLADREANMLSTDLRQEYERQLQNIRSLRTLYEERARLAEVTRQGLLRELEDLKTSKEAATEKVKDLTTKVEELETRVDELQETISNKNNQIYTCQDETRGLKSEMSAVNKLFSQVLLGYKSKQDLDTLVHRLEENHGILTHMAENENDSEASSALPKLLLEIVSQVDEMDRKLKHDGDEAKDSDNGQTAEVSQSTAEEIVQNLPKVWRVLVELLSHQTTIEENESEKVTTCYKTVETKTGPVQVPSVSQTYIRLKDLIVEKLGLVKEVNRMKQLNVHLETRLEEQERRLCLVTTELSKTWHVVGRLRRHHHQLHTHEKILKYELQQKRKLLTELKEELEYCREKWDQAREKNSQSEKDWKKLRAEFSSRNTKSFNNSAESGYSDERPSDESSESNDESEYNSEPIRLKKKMKKSFETVMDSSTDRNLAAEREDPASDMLDVADLSLDTQDSYDQHDASSFQDSKKSVQKSEKVCESEDEVAEITHDSCTEDHLTANHIQPGENLNQSKNTTSSLSNSKISIISLTKGISMDVKEKTVSQPNKHESMPIKGEEIASYQTEINTDEINITLETILKQPSSSTHRISESNATAATKGMERNKDVMEDKCKDMSVDVFGNYCISEVKQDHPAMLSKVESVELDLKHNSENNESLNTLSISGPSFKDELCNSDIVKKVDFKAILESVRAQNERLARKDERLQKLESGCSGIVDKISKTVSAEENIIRKLDNLHDSTLKKQNSSSDLTDKQSITLSEPSISKVELNNKSVVNYDGEHSIRADIIKNSTENLEPQESDLSSASNRDSSEPSTSSEVDHEAIFAARDLRLKRLEEQTKSLVNKVNKTTDKGIKIHYKLEELHNIYGSESSRAGTPSDSEEKDKEYDDKNVTEDENNTPQ